VFAACDCSVNGRASGSDDGGDGGSAGQSDGGGGNNNDSGGGGSSDSGSAGPGAPKIVSLTPSPSSITQSGSFTVVANVTDPAGVANLAGGKLVTLGGAEIGAFNSISAGTYSITVTWDELNAAGPINFTGSNTLDLQAQFSNEQAKQASRTMTITLTCGSGSFPSAACNGVCVNLDADSNNCGACGHAIPSFETCTNGIPVCPMAGQTACASACASLQSDPNNCGTCGNVCGALGASTEGLCYSGVCDAWVYSTSVDESCASACASLSGAPVCSTAVGSPYSVYTMGAGVILNGCDTVPPATNASGGSFWYSECYCLQ
jgi:hypothetical protein